jgi:hypothetical protein
MNAVRQTAIVDDIRVRLSTMWVVVMFNMAFADIFSFMHPDFLQQVAAGSTGQMQVTPGFLVVAAILVEIPIAMIILSRVLKHRVNRWANIVASVITIVFVVAGGSTAPHYIFFAAIEIVCMALIIWWAWKWSNPEA